jgi:hypothetical protein
VRHLGCLALIAGLLTAPATAEPLALGVHPIRNFSLTGGEPDEPLSFLGGLQVTSENPLFGGVSGVTVSDTSQVLLLTDSGNYIRARLVHQGGRLAGIADAEIAPFLPGDGSKGRGDTEDIAFDPADPSRGVVVRERQANAMLTFVLRDGVPADFTPTTVGADNRLLQSNTGLESVDYAPPASPVAGEIVAIAERPPRGETDIPGWIAGIGAFSIVRHDDFDVSSARFLPDGDLLLLERRFAPAWGIGTRLRRIPGETLGVGARLDGEIILDAGMTSQIDNMEGLAVSRDAAGRTILTLVSDDNFNAFQRTLILQFALGDAP